MPCDSSGYDESESYALRTQLDEVTALLCAVCKHIDDNPVVYLRNLPNLRDWWAVHQEIDAKKKQRLAAQARKKLTQEELDDLLC